MTGALGGAAEARLAEDVGRWRAGAGVPGVAVAVVDAGGRVSAVRDGLADVAGGTAVEDHHRFQLGSIGKSFAAIALLRLGERGLVELGAPVRRWLPWFDAGAHTGRITLHHLLTHTSGLPVGPDLSDASAFDVWALRGLDTQPPGRYWYSNAGYKALGLVLEAVGDASCPEVIEREVLRPLGLSGTRASITHTDRPAHAVGYEPEPDRAPWSRAPRVPAPFLATSTADGSIVATASDVARYLAVLLGRGTGLGLRLLQDVSFAALIGRHVRTDPGAWYGYGMGTRRLDGREVFGHGGDMLGFRASLVGDPGGGVGVVVLANLRSAPTARLAHHALRIAWADRARTTWPWPDAVDPPALRLRGAWGAADAQLAIDATGAAPQARWQGHPVELARRDADAMELDHPEAGRWLVRVERDRAGVARLLTHGPDTLLPAGSRPSSAHHPTGLDRYTGRYRSGNPWRRTVEVIERAGRPWLVEADGSESRLVRVGPDRFRDGATPNPERVEFDAMVGGRALRMLASGAPLYRSDAG